MNAQMRLNATPPTGETSWCDVGFGFGVGVGVGFGASSPHNGPASAGFGNACGTQPCGVDARAPQLSSVLLQHQSLRVSTGGACGEGRNRQVKGAHWGRRPWHSGPACCREYRCCSCPETGPSRCCEEPVSRLKPFAVGETRTVRVARSTSVCATLGRLRRRRQKLQLPGSQYVYGRKKRDHRKKKTDEYSLQPGTEQSSDMPAVMLVISGRDILFCLEGGGLGKQRIGKGEGGENAILYIR